MAGQFCDNFIMTEDGENFEMTQTTKGDPGEGVPTGGTAGQVLKKVSGDDYDTEWADHDAGDVGFDSTETYQSGTVGAELSDLSRQISDVEDRVDAMPIAPLSVLTLAEYGEDWENTTYGRKITKTGNRFTMRCASSSTTYRTVRLFGGYNSVSASNVPGVTYENSIAVPAVTSSVDVFAIVKSKYVSGTGNSAFIYLYEVDSEDNVISTRYNMSNITTSFALKLDPTKRFNAGYHTRNAAMEYDVEISLVAFPSGIGVEPDDAMSETSTKPVQNRVIKAYVDSVVSHGYSVVQVSGTIAEIAAQADTMYVCGELASLDITSLPTSGIVIIIYSSGSTATVVTLPQTVMMPAWFESAANETVMIGITNGTLGSVQTWS